MTSIPNDRTRVRKKHTVLSNCISNMMRGIRLLRHWQVRAVCVSRQKWDKSWKCQGTECPVTLLKPIPTPSLSIEKQWFFWERRKCLITSELSLMCRSHLWKRESSYFIALPSQTPDDDIVKLLLLSPTFFVHGGDSKEGDGIFHGLLILSSYLLWPLLFLNLLLALAAALLNSTLLNDSELESDSPVSPPPPNIVYFI